MTRPVLSLGFSPCPNDTFIFHSLVKGLVPSPFAFAERLEDVETLNQLALRGELDVTKISYHLLGHIREEYALLRSGGALGFGCGPLVVSRTFRTREELAGKRVAIPGKYTTAALLLHILLPEVGETVCLPFHEIMPAVARGDFDAGVIIHESRFTFAEHGLASIADLGAWWERETGGPIPLGGIVARRSLGAETLAALERLLAQSVRRSLAAPEECRSYIRAHSQEMSDEVCAAHIALYVNDFSIDLGAEGERAVRELLRRGEIAGLFPPSARDPFALHNYNFN